MNYSNKVDIWALGIVFYELVAGWPLFQGKYISYNSPCLGIDLWINKKWANWWKNRKVEFEPWIQNINKGNVKPRTW